MDNLSFISRPYGTCFLLSSQPGDKSPRYYHMSLWDKPSCSVGTFDNRPALQCREQASVPCFSPRGTADKIAFFACIQHTTQQFRTFPIYVFTS